MVNRKESPDFKAKELGLVIQGTTINRNAGQGAELQTPFTRYDTNHINFASGNFGPSVASQRTLDQNRPATSSIQHQASGGRRTPGRQTCCSKLGKKSRRKLTIDKENN